MAKHQKAKNLQRAEEAGQGVHREQGDSHQQPERHGHCLATPRHRRNELRQTHVESASKAPHNRRMHWQESAAVDEVQRRLRQARQQEVPERAEGRQANDKGQAESLPLSCRKRHGRGNQARAVRRKLDPPRHSDPSGAREDLQDGQLEIGSRREDRDKPHKTESLPTCPVADALQARGQQYAGQGTAIVAAGQPHALDCAEAPAADCLQGHQPLNHLECYLPRAQALLQEVCAEN
mmetsp:Transcript_38099/g.108817  ORF Transcript_38099/g.108817 Transcript_38099/m.108817 type:complete len:236 (+) Transcript_38099:1675-2382(+)